jgi:hypothetical protein
MAVGAQQYLGVGPVGPDRLEQAAQEGANLLATRPFAEPQSWFDWTLRRFIKNACVRVRATPCNFTTSRWRSTQAAASGLFRFACCRRCRPRFGLGGCWR